MQTKGFEMFSFTVRINLIIDGVAQNGAKVAVAGFVKEQDLISFMKNWESWKGICLYVSTPRGEEVWLNGAKI